MRAYLEAIFRRRNDEDGQALAEYGLLLALIAIVCVTALAALGLAIGVPLNELMTQAGWGAGGS